MNPMTRRCIISPAHSVNVCTANTTVLKPLNFQMDHEDGAVPKSQDSVEKRLGRTTLLDSGEDFEMLEDVDDDGGGGDDDDDDDDLPPLEDGGGGKTESHQANETAKEIPDPSQRPPREEWLDVLGTSATFARRCF